MLNDDDNDQLSINESTDPNGATAGIPDTLNDAQLNENRDVPSPPSITNDPDLSTRANLNNAPKSPVTSRTRSKTNQVSISEKNNMFLAMIAEPVTVEEAMSGTESKKWRKAMNNEMKSLNKTWSLEKLPSAVMH